MNASAPTNGMPAAIDNELLHGLDPALRGVAIRLIREIDEPGLDAAQLQSLRSFLNHLDVEISARLNMLGGQD
ncbi:hypothetical protein [Amycolatopsis sp. YIM 10]|uniref:hypothetical protein n=1 Tax=Amycolatopsis sp. YIM 10 TaxID=2653857 RepID=UPI00128FD035|nr:hypothetical protein [Amycolatopsis sp. YIM 10]QFU86987.1 hypothetical protein YIM_08885 [Amycolatopsis sp. YIM 10]